MPEDKSALDQALDLLFFAPVGLLLTARQELPSLVEKGRQRVTGQATVARMVGKFAVAHGQKEVERATSKLVKQAVEAVSHLGTDPSTTLTGVEAADTSPSASRTARSPGPAGSAPAGPAIAGAHPDPDRTGVGSGLGAPMSASPPNGRSAAPAGDDAGPLPERATAEEATSVADPATLAIPGYDVLSASQVVQRLAGLAPSELDAVGRYEAATRGRRTILSKVAQLQIED